ncbi:MAG TPA: F0F1 ATP synthase subunit B [Dongiaceae bacterium]|jgi:F-type H+-transporting ATPase subunit b
MGIFSNPETWVAIAFIIFVVLAGKPIVRMLGKSLDDRAARIKAELDEAKALRDEAQRLLVDYQKKQQAAMRDAENIVAHARGEAERLKTEAAANLDAAFARREKMALDKIAQAEAQAIADVRNHAIDVAVAAAEQLLKGKTDNQRGERLIDSAIAELERKLN